MNVVQRWRPQDRFIGVPYLHKSRRQVELAPAFMFLFTDNQNLPRIRTNMILDASRLGCYPETLLGIDMFVTATGIELECSVV